MGQSNIKMTTTKKKKEEPKDDNMTITAFNKRFMHRVQTSSSSALNVDNILIGAMSKKRSLKSDGKIA